MERGIVCVSILITKTVLSVKRIKKRAKKQVRRNSGESKHLYTNSENTIIGQHKSQDSYYNEQDMNLYTENTPERTLMDTGEFFSHGSNLFGIHVDAVVVISKQGYPVFQREATPKEVLRYCK